MNSSRKFGLGLAGVLAVASLDATEPVAAVKGGRFALACDENHALLLKPDGTVQAWGGNEHGQLGDGTENDSAGLVTVAGLSDVIDVATNHNFSMALRRDGTVWSWGSNEWGQLGDGTYDSRSQPALVSSLAGIVAISAGSVHALALKNDGTVWAWGSNENSRLGDGTLEDGATPRKVASLTDVVVIAAGELSSVALKKDGSIWQWGLVPSAERELKNERAVAIKAPARRARGKSGGSLPPGSSHVLIPRMPAEIFRLEGANSVVAGLHNFLALKNDGTVWIMGENEFGQLSDGTKNANWSSFGPVRGLTGIVAIAARSEDLLALGADGAVWQWGQSAGLSTFSGAFDSAAPVRVPGITDAVAIATGGNNDAAIRADGTVITWGVDHVGQVASPNPVTAPVAVECSPLTLHDELRAEANAAPAAPHPMVQASGALPAGLVRPPRDGSRQP